jgi:hypothetical protein
MARRLDTVTPLLLSRTRGSVAVPLHAGISARIRDDGKAGSEGVRSERIGRPPSPGAHTQHVVSRLRQRIRPHRRQVLIHQRHAHQKVVRAIGAPGKCANRQGQPPRLDVERPCGPWLPSNEQRRRVEQVVLEPDFAQQIDSCRKPLLEHQPHAELPQRAVLVIRVIEKRIVIRATDGCREFASPYEAGWTRRRRILARE